MLGNVGGAWRPAEPPAPAKNEGSNQGSKCAPTSRRFHKCASRQLGPLAALSEMTPVSIHALRLRCGREAAAAFATEGLNISFGFLTLTAGLPLPAVAFVSITRDSVKGQQNVSSLQLPRVLLTRAAPSAERLLSPYLICWLPCVASLFVSRCLANSLKSLSG